MAELEEKLGDWAYRGLLPGTSTVEVIAHRPLVRAGAVCMYLGVIC
ncbi:MAG: hypothetical protein H7A19_13225 [Rhodanobacteraceae bacterium]|nr:hypothetical protein [Rhodanobacteraceae bacterium]